MKFPAGLIAGGLSALIGVVLFPIAIAELLRYSPYEDPGAGQAGLAIGLLSVVLMAIPVLIIVLRAASRLHHQRKAWLATLTAEQRGQAYLAEAAGMTALHLYLRRRNKEQSARLTASVMGTGSLNDVHVGARQMTARLAQNVTDDQP